MRSRITIIPRAWHETWEHTICPTYMKYKLYIRVSLLEYDSWNKRWQLFSCALGPIGAHIRTFHVPWTISRRMTYDLDHFNKFSSQQIHSSSVLTLKIKKQIIRTMKMYLALGKIPCSINHVTIIILFVCRNFFVSL